MSFLYTIYTTSLFIHQTNKQTYTVPDTCPPLPSSQLLSPPQVPVAEEFDRERERILFCGDRPTAIEQQHVVVDTYSDRAVTRRVSITRGATVTVERVNLRIMMIIIIITIRRRRRRRRRRRISSRGRRTVMIIITTVTIMMIIMMIMK